MEFLKDSNGQFSSMRVMSFMIVFMVMVGWCGVSWKQGELAVMTPDLLGLVGLALGGKTVQKFIEKPVIKSENVEK